MEDLDSFRGVALALALGIGLLWSCGPSIEDESEKKLSCQGLCAQHEECGSDYSQRVESLDECVDECLEPVAPSACGDLLIVYNDCSAELACEEFLVLFGPDLDPETGPCPEERTAFSQCVANNR